MRSRFVLPLAVLALLGAACGDKTHSEAVKLVEEVASKTREAGSSRLETLVTIESEQFENDVAVTASGAFDFASGSGELEMTLPSELGGSAFGEGTVRMIVVEGSAFVQLPGQDMFVEVPADQLSGSGPLAPGNPSDLFAFLVGGPEGVEDLGTEDVRGQPKIDQPGVGQGTIGVDMELSDYGVAVDVQRPPPDKITEAPG